MSWVHCAPEIYVLHHIRSSDIHLQRLLGNTAASKLYQDLLEISNIWHFLEPAHTRYTSIVHKMIHYKRIDKTNGHLNMIFY